MRKVAWLVFMVISIGLILGQFTGHSVVPASSKKIGVLIASDLRLLKVEGLREGLPQYGLVEGKNVEIIVKNAKDNLAILPQLAQELVAADVDVIVTTGTFETFAARDVVGERKIPLIFVGVGCSVEMGLVQDIVSPGCNITGVDSHYVQLSGKRLEYLKRLSPAIKRVLVLYNPRSTPIGPSAIYLYEAAEKLGVELTLTPVATQEQVIATLQTVNKEEYGGIMLMCSLLFESMTEQITKWSIAATVPVMGVSEQQTAKGLLASYGLPYKEEGKQGARIVSSVLRNKNAADTPIESPAKLEFYLNVDTARKLGLPIDRASLPFVTHYIEAASGGTGR